ncbi:hypothetical protein CO050_04485, partial [Candidatus Roizmanbacteria bacterium CG_4_9_14_0_2_um_filter_38_17]
IKALETFEHAELPDKSTKKDALLPRQSIWLERWYEFGRIDWVGELEYPEWTNKEVNRFLQA